MPKSQYVKLIILLIMIIELNDIQTMSPLYPNTYQNVLTILRNTSFMALFLQYNTMKQIMLTHELKFLLTIHIKIIYFSPYSWFITETTLFGNICFKI